MVACAQKKKKNNDNNSIIHSLMFRVQNKMYF